MNKLQHSWPPNVRDKDVLAGKIRAEQRENMIKLVIASWSESLSL